MEFEDFSTIWVSKKSAKAWQGVGVFARRRRRNFFFFQRQKLDFKTYVD
jgi:hypothetical protein